MIRKIIHIDEDKCNGCGICVNACHEGAIGLVDSKAKLLRDDYCDGMGDCLPTCPTGAITFEEREALAYDEEAVKKNMMKKKIEQKNECSCPSSKVRMMEHKESVSNVDISSQLRNWPIQIKLAPINAPYFDGAKLLIAADCTAYAYANFHKDFIRNKVTLIGCPKLDGVDYSEKLTEIIRNNDILSVTVVRMEVPCCGGIEMAVKKALQASGKFIPWNVITVSIEGEIMD